MQRIADPTATSDRRFTEGSPASGTPATVVTADWLNGIQEELCSAIEGSGQTLNGATVNQLWRAIFEMSHPVGSYYWTRDLTRTPNQILGFGTWTQVPAGRVLVTIDTAQPEFDTLGETGGEKAHQLTVDELALHGHPTIVDTSGDDTIEPSGGIALDSPGGASSVVFGAWTGTPDSTAGHQVGGTGGNQPHNNLQPYYVAGNCWYRTA